MVIRRPLFFLFLSADQIANYSRPERPIVTIEFTEFTKEYWTILLKIGEFLERAGENLFCINNFNITSATI
jgi:hypothetical protein